MKTVQCSTEKFFIIECGYSIRCHPNYPEQLYDQLNIGATNSVKSIFITFADYTKLVLEAFATVSVVCSMAYFCLLMHTIAKFF